MSKIQLHRIITAPTERVFRAFTDPEALVKWMAPHGFTAKVHHMDLRVGGTYKMSFTNFTTKSAHTFGGTYTEIKTNEVLKYSDKFDDPNMPGEMKMTISLKEVMCGTELHITQEGIPEMIPLEMCYLGWQQSLDMLIQLVEPTIPDGK